MDDCILELVAYANNRCAGSCLSDIEEKLGRENLWLAVINMLGWLRVFPASPRFEHGLWLSSVYSGTYHVKRVVAETSLRDFLVVREYELRFRDEVGPERRNEIRQYVRENHHLQMDI